MGGTTQNNSCIARLTNTGALDTTFVNNQNLSGEIRGIYIYPHNYPDSLPSGQNSHLGQVQCPIGLHVLQ